MADEINRASPKTQSALLEVMEERQVTVDGVARPVPRPFVVVATQNPIEMDGTYRLPEAQLDRFLMRIAIGYPDSSGRAPDADQRGRRRRLRSLQPVVTAAGCRDMIDQVVTCPCQRGHAGLHRRPLGGDPGAARGPAGGEPPGRLLCCELDRALAAASGRSYAVPEDVKALAELRTGSSDDPPTRRRTPWHDGGRDHSPGARRRAGAPNRPRSEPMLTHRGVAAAAVTVVAYVAAAVLHYPELGVLAAGGLLVMVSGRHGSCAVPTSGSSGPSSRPESPGASWRSGCSRSRTPAGSPCRPRSPRSSADRRRWRWTSPV